MLIWFLPWSIFNVLTRPIPTEVTNLIWPYVWSAAIVDLADGSPFLVPIIGMSWSTSDVAAKSVQYVSSLLPRVVGFIVRGTCS